MPFSYYGSKQKIAKLYPEPKYDLIIEPFSGAAHYSLFHKKKAILNDKSEIIYNIWKWLIEEATENFILSNSDFYLNEDLRNFNLPEQYKSLIGFNANRGSTSPRNIIQKWSCQSKKNPNYASSIKYFLENLCKKLDLIKTFEIHNEDYNELKNIEATWFIDPPYQFGGELYPHSNLDYKELLEWAGKLKGQIIICENQKNNWLPNYKTLKEIHGQKNKSVEVYYEF